MKKVRTIKEIKKVLANYDGHYVKCSNGWHYVTVDLIEEAFETRDELLAWATFTFWNRDMQAA